MTGQGYVLRGKVKLKGLGQYNGQRVYCGLSTASEVFLVFTTQLYQYFSVFFPI